MSALLTHTSLLKVFTLLPETLNRISGGRKTIKETECIIEISSLNSYIENNLFEIVVSLYTIV